MLGFSFTNEISNQLTTTVFTPLWRMLPNFPFVKGATSLARLQHLSPVSSSSCFSSVSPSSVWAWTKTSVSDNLKVIFDQLSLSERRFQVDLANILPPMREKPNDLYPGETILPSLSELGLLSYSRPYNELKYPFRFRPRSPSLASSPLHSDSGDECDLIAWMKGLSLDDS